VREETSARSLAYLKTHSQVPTLVDVNLRDPWWALEKTSAQIREVEWAKLNREEVVLLGDRPVGTRKDLVAVARQLREKLEIGALVVTMGADGALALDDGGIVDAAAPNLPEVVDTVGAGDAFTAVLALGIHHAWPLDLTLQRASEFAGEICRIRGAIPPDSQLYSRHLRRWVHAS
jgi:fructokinase